MQGQADPVFFLQTGVFSYLIIVHPKVYPKLICTPPSLFFVSHQDHSTGEKLLFPQELSR